MSADSHTSVSGDVLETLVVAGLIDDAGARRALQVARTSGESVVAVVHQLALADDARVVEALSARCGLRIVAESDIPAAPIEVNDVSVSFLRRRRLLPLGWSGDNLLVGIVDPQQSDGLAALAFATQHATEPLLMSVSAQKRAFDMLFGATETAESEVAATPSLWADDAQRVRDQSSAGPAVRLVDALLEEALEQNASDIHIEPLPDRVRVRLRVDGALKDLREEPAHLAAPIAARIKVLADMDIADRRSAQDGRTSLAARGRPVDVRISSVPSAYGETIALRLLRRDASLLNLQLLGFSQPIQQMLRRVLEARRGLFLISGPTGSGKTTTLYAMIELLRGSQLKIISIEDPIEYFFTDITQVQVNEDAGLTFPTALRSFLRQDPDVILIGEIRDGETARIAVQAALTGHLVLATLHTTDAPGVVSRLVDLGLDRYLVAATLAGAASQRLVRKLCTCATRRQPTPAERALIEPALGGERLQSVAAPAGCDACRGSGVSGRIAVAEGFIVNDTLREAMSDTATERLTEALRRQGFTPLSIAAAREAADGRIAPIELQTLALA
jgi:general secretion pathway protein E